MFKIGEFSRFSRVSVKMLRHYDELGLLTPARVDPATNYRYYSANQLPRLNRILALKDLGFSLEQIGLLLNDDVSTEQMRGMLKLRRTEIQAQLQETEERLARVAARLNQIDGAEKPPPYDVVLRAVEPCTVACSRQVVPVNTPQITRLFETIEAYVARYSARAVLPPLMLYHDMEYREGAQDVEVAIPIRGAVPATEQIDIRALDGHDSMACVIHTGSYDTLSRALSLLLGWIEANHYDIAGPIRETYLRFGADQDGYEIPDAYLAHSAADFVTELQVPVEKATNR